MESGTDLDAERPDFLGNGTGAANAARWTVEGREKAIAGRFHLITAKACEISPDRGVMIVEEIAPALVPKRGGFLGRADDIVKSTVASTRSTAIGARDPVRNSSIASEISSAFSPTK